MEGTEVQEDGRVRNYSPNYLLAKGHGGGIGWAPVLQNRTSFDPYPQVSVELKSNQKYKNYFQEILLNLPIFVGAGKRSI